MLSTLFLLISLPGFSKSTVTALKCDYHVNPIGMDVSQPRLSWQIVAAENNFVQQAYEIRVAESLDKLAQGSKLVWSSGKVTSSESVNVVYSGPAAKSMQRFWWQVRIWDPKGKATAWSEPSFWEMGLLNAGDWKASWIRLGQDPDNTISRPVQFFRKEFSVAKKIKSASCINWFSHLCQNCVFV